LASHSYQGFPELWPRELGFSPDLAGGHLGGHFVRLGDGGAPKTDVGAPLSRDRVEVVEPRVCFAQLIHCLDRIGAAQPEKRATRQSRPRLERTERDRKGGDDEVRPSRFGEGDRLPFARVSGRSTFGSNRQRIARRVRSPTSTRLLPVAQTKKFVDIEGFSLSRLVGSVGSLAFNFAAAES
jgi:hypothetical protein